MTTNEKSRDRTIDLAKQIADVVTGQRVIVAPWELDCALDIAKALISCDLSANFEDDEEPVVFPVGLTTN